MFKNYLKLAYRNLIKNPFYSLVNIIGLAAGIAFTLIISSYIWSEWNVNRNLKNADRQYIIQSKWKNPNQGIELTTFGPLAKALQIQYPDLVKNYYRWDGVTSNVSKGEKAFREGLQICDSTMFEMYGFKLIFGDPKTAFEGPYSLIITDEKAIKYFGRTDVVGETLTIENFSGSKHDFAIKGVMKKPSRNSVTWVTPDNDNQFYISSANINYFGRTIESWQNQYIPGYIELQAGIEPTQITAPIDQLIKLNVAPSIASNVITRIVPLQEFYLNSFNGVIRKLIYALGSIAIFILLMAVINFINLSVSRSSTRMKEIGIRKVMGGLKYQLIYQFLIESIVLTLIATGIAICISEMIRPLFSSIMGKAIPSFFSFPFYYYGILIFGIIVIGSAAGLYPAFVLSAVQSVDSIKGKSNSIVEKVILRKTLVGFQFCIASMVCIGAIIISKQVNYFFNKDLGFSKDYIVSAQVPRNWTAQGVHHMNDLRNQFAAMPEVKSASLSFEVLDGNSSGGISLYRADRDSTFAVASQILTTDENFSSTYSIPMLAGDFYSSSGAVLDFTKIVINESQLKALGWSTPQDALNKQVRIVGNPFVLNIAGVTKDFNFGSFSSAIQPITFMQVGLNPIYRVFSFKLNPGDMSKSIAALQNKWNMLMPGTPFEYAFMDEKLSSLYRTELQLKKASYAATLLSMIIVFLGVLGLIGLSLQKRIKEVGIRKVLGSSVAGIVSLFVKEFLIIIFIAGLIACPSAYLIMNHWLKSYVYRVDMTMAPFIIAISFLGLLTAALICLQTLKVANSNPMESLRSE